MSGVIDGGWRLLSSQRTTALLALLFASTAFLAAVIPQGNEALYLAKEQQAQQLHDLAAWGLTEIFVSPFFYALAALLIGNLAAIAVSGLRAQSSAIPIDPPRRPALDRELRTSYPEYAPEILRETFISRLGQPIAQAVQGPRVVMVFDSGSGAQLAPLLTHLGLMLLVLGAGLYAAYADGKTGMPRAILEITDPQTNTTGTFDMAAGEPFQLFQYPARYIIRDYVPSREGQGPAVRIERRDQNQEQGVDFWVYKNAPEGFDRRHRNGEVWIEGVWMGMSPLPGQGLADSPLGVLMVLGMALIGVGAAQSRRPRGRLWVDAQGDVVRLAGVPYAVGDPDFKAAFDRWSLHAQAALKED